MQWAPGKNLGFSTAPAKKLYLSIDGAPDAPTVAAQERDPNSLLNRVRHLIQLKKTELALAAYAEFVPVYAKADTYPFVFARAAGKDVLLAMFNPADKEASAGFSLNIGAKALKLLSGTESKIDIQGTRYTVRMAGQSYSLYKVLQ